MFGKKSRRSNIDKLYPHVLLNGSKRQTRFAEAYRTLRTNIHFSMIDKKLRSLIVTSAGQAEGKTVTVFNLAHTLAQAGRPVVVVDADLRKPMLSRLYPEALPKEDSASKGLTGILAEEFGAPVHSGWIKDMSVQDLFQILALQKKTGRVKIENDRETVEVSLVRGRPADVNWITRPQEKRLAAILVRKGLLSPEDAELALKRRKDTGQKLGFILVHMGFVPEAELRGPLTLHLSEALHVLFDIRDGSYEFTEESVQDNERPLSHPDLIGPLFDQFRKTNPSLPYLSGRIAAQIFPTGIENLSLLPSGIIPPNPSELLGTDGMPFLIRMLSQSYDLVVIDTPPVLPASDALLLAPATDGALLVIKAGLLRRNLIAKAAEQLRTAKANLLGVILNDVDVNREGYYKYYRKYYQKYYSDSY